jgi:hypothetical protein
MATRCYRNYVLQWWDVPQLLEVVDFVWANTTHSDDMLRQATADAATLELKHFMQKKHIRNADCMPEKDSFAWYLLSSAAEHISKSGASQRVRPMRT